MLSGPRQASAPDRHPSLDRAADPLVQERVDEASSARALEQAQLLAYAEDVRTSYAREIERTRELERSYLATVRALAAAVEAKDDYTGGHIQRVHGLGLLLARTVVPEEAADVQLSYGFLLHDIGKLAVPDAVLTKAGPLTDDEWTLMRAHPQAGVRILSEIPFLGRALDVVLHHHERWDGTGYPHGLSGEDIPLWARIFAVVDAVDAMTSDRPYRRGLPLDVALAELRSNAGVQFDPACVEAFARLDPATLRPWLQRPGGVGADAQVRRSSAGDG
jgi:HD-GYP domain-containing protein (c-di-GMP phosphodiesterase class II)